MKLTDNASKWYRMHSQRALIFIASAQGLIVAMPQTMQYTRIFGFTLDEVLTALTVVAAVLGFVGRLLQQDTVSG